MDGFFIIDKPKAITSQGVCTRIKKKFNTPHVGHSGTLDPDTTGVLVVAVGKATKMLKLINEHDKIYEATIVFGLDSNTLDISGNITNDIKMDFDNNALNKALEELYKMTEQIPPMVSAIKVNGQKMCDLERKGKTVDLPPRKTRIKEYKILKDLYLENGHLEFKIYLSVTKGFYVRSFARDLGKALGGCAILKELRRVSCGDFNVDMATPLEDIDFNSLKSITDIFPNFKSLEIKDYLVKLVKNGIILDERQIVTDEVFYVTHKGDIIAIYEPYEENKYKPIIVF